MNMKKFENFSNCLNVLKNADFEKINEEDIYRTGIIGQFNMTFELAWKALQVVLRLHGVEAAETGSPRDILQIAYKFHFINDPTVWLTMLKKRNIIAHVYSEDEADELILLIRDSFINAFVALEKTLKAKFEDLETQDNKLF